MVKLPGLADAYGNAAAWDKPRFARNGFPESLNSFVCFVYPARDLWEFVVKLAP
jgi:hypothetical protein